MAVNRPLKLDYSSNSYISFQASQPIQLPAKFNNLKEVGQVGPDDMSNSLIWSIEGEPSSDQSIRSVQEVRDWLEQQSDTVSHVEILKPEKRYKRGGEF